MKKLLRTVAVAAMSLSLIAGSAVSADAAKRAHVNVVKLRAKDVVVKSKKCHTVKVKLKKKSNTAYWDVYTKVTKKGKNLVSTKNKYQRFAQFHGGFEGSTTDRVKICPAKTGLGKAKLGPSKTNAVFNEWGKGQTNRTDKTKGHFYIRGKAKVSLKAHKTGNKVKLTAAAKRYKPTAKRPGYAPFTRTVKFQAKTAHGWKTLKTKKLKKGTGSVTVPRTSATTYRVTFGKIASATGATSKSVRK